MTRSIIHRKMNNRGFTLAEVLLAVAIIMILIGVTTFGITSYMANNRQAAADRAAESIAISFQNRLNEIYAFDRADSDMLKNGSVSSLIGTKTIQIQSEFAEGGAIDVDVEYCVIGEEKGFIKLGADDVLKILTAEGELIESDLYKNGIILEFDPVNYRVYSVIYCSDVDKFPIETLYSESNMASIRDSVESRISNFKGYVGYYQMESEDGEALIDNDTKNQINIKVGHYVNGERRLYNSDMLQANIEIVFPKEGTNYTDKLKYKRLLLRVEIKGEISKNKIVFAEWGTYLDTMEYTQIPLVLDAFGESQLNGKLQTFNGQFTADGSLPSYEDVFKTVAWIPEGKVAKKLNEEDVEDESAYLIPGENIIVTVNASTYASYTGLGEVTEDRLLTATASASDNSLFAYDNGIYTVDGNIKTGVDEGEYKAFIACGRHLQNLDESSGIETAIKTDKLQVTSLKAVQTKDIDFKELLEDEILVENEHYAWCDCYEGKNFTPIINKFITSYSGVNEGEETEEGEERHSIKNLTIDESDLDNSAVLELNDGKSAAVSRTYLEKNEDYSVTVNGTVVYERYCAGLFRVFHGEEISGLILVDPKITGIQKVGIDPEQDDEADNVVSSTGALAGILLNEATIMDCKIEITGKEIPEGEEDEMPTGWIRTKIEE